MFRRLKFVKETPTILMLQGLTPDDVVVRQAELLLEGKSLWDYVSFAYLFNKPYSPKLVQQGLVVDAAPPRHTTQVKHTPKPAKKPKGPPREKGKPYGPRSLNQLMGVPEHKDLWPYIRKLPDRQLALIRSYYIHGTSRNDICQMMGWKSSTFNAAISRALSALRDIIGKEGVPHA